MIKNIIYKNYKIEGNYKSYPKRIKIFACDTETIQGLPYTIQIYDGKEVFFKYVNKNNILDIFLSYIHKKSLSGQTNIVYFHNLEYDISVIFYNYHKEFLGKKVIKIKYKGWSIKLVLSNTTFCILKKNKKRILLLDSNKFINTSLEKFGEMINSKYKKLNRPSFLGERAPKNEKEKKFFEEYAIQDVLVQYEIAKWIIEKHKKYNIRISFSNANFSERIFRHYFVKEYMNIALPKKEWVEKSILSYHGGKNGYYLDKDNVYFIKDVVEIDIVSAYPYAMMNIPNIGGGKYIEVDTIVEEYEGVYIVDGVCLNDKYPILFSHDFKIIPYGEKINNLCITSYELKEAIKNNEIEVKKVKGLVYKPFNIENPLHNFVKEFFEKKKTANNVDEKMLFKIILNSLYGKFIQAIEIEDKKRDYTIETEKGTVRKVEKVYQAGQCFHPFFASLITGFIRVYLHKIEHLTQCFHSSTDSVICKKEQVKNVKHLLGSDLGCLEVKTSGNVYLFRNKLYVFVDDKGKILKYALHGFLGTPEMLLQLLKEKQNVYKVKKMIKVREAERLKNKQLIKLAINEIERNLNGVNLNKLVIM